MYCLSGYEDFPVAQTVKKNLPAMQETRVPSLGREDSPGGGYGNPPVFLPEESHGQRSLAGYSPWRQKELDTTEQRTHASGYYLCYVNDSFETSCIVAAAAKSLRSCPTLCDPIDGSPPGSPVPGILQARTLEWVAISFSSA